MYRQDCQNDEKEDYPVLFPPPLQLNRQHNVAREAENIRLAQQPNIPEEHTELGDPELNTTQIAGKKSKPKSKYVPDNMCNYSGEWAPCPEEYLIKRAKAREAYRKKKSLQGKNRSSRKSPNAKKLVRKNSKKSQKKSAKKSQKKSASRKNSKKNSKKR